MEIMSLENSRKKKRKRPTCGAPVRRKKVKERRPHFVISFSECGFCREGSDSDDNYRGTFFQNELENIAAHQFCLLFSCGLPQSGTDNDGFDGFLFEDIRKEMRRASRIQCKFCDKYGASSGCAVKSCCGTYHYKCGIENGTQFDFHGTFNTYCSVHRSYQDMAYILNGSRTPGCPICLDDIANLQSILKMPCCKNVFAHKSCIQRQAISSGYFFKCPTCKNEKLFKREMAKYGVYIPLRDATWEENNAYSDLLQQYKNCDIPSCKCPMGKGYEDEDGDWELIRCYHCGQGAVHSRCLGNRSIPKYGYVCQDCNDAIGVLKQSTFLAGNCAQQTLGQKKLIEERLANGDPLVTECMRNALWERFNIQPCRVEVMRIPPPLVKLIEMVKGKGTQGDSPEVCQQDDIVRTYDHVEEYLSTSTSVSPVHEPETLPNSSETGSVQNNESTAHIVDSSNSYEQVSTSETTESKDLEKRTDSVETPLSNILSIGSPETFNSVCPLPVDTCIDNLSSMLSDGKATPVESSDSPSPSPFETNHVPLNEVMELIEDDVEITDDLKEISSDTATLSNASWITDVSMNSNDIIDETTHSTELNIHLNLQLNSPHSSKEIIIREDYPLDISIETVSVEDESSNSLASLPFTETIEIPPSPSCEQTFCVVETSATEAVTENVDEEVICVTSIDSTASLLSNSSQLAGGGTFTGRSKITYYMNAAKSTPLQTNNNKNKIRKKRKKEKNKLGNNTALDKWLRKENVSSTCNDDDVIITSMPTTLINRKFPRILLSKCSVI